MKICLKLVLSLSTFTFLFFYSASSAIRRDGSFTPVLAASEFIASYNVTYEALNTGSMFVTQDVSLTNRLSNIYATQYSFTLDKGQPKNITAFDSLGPVRVTIEKEGEKNTIILHFNEQIVGRDKILKFTLKYEITDLVSQAGQIWEITLPKINNLPEIDSYTAFLKVPLSFGKLAYVSPNPKTQKNEGGTQVFSFDKEQISQSGVVAAFGEMQVFDFTLTYHLSNPHLNHTETSIAFPPDTNYQKMIYQRIDPPPENMEVDEDGNWLGTYKLGPGGRKEIVAVGQVQIFAKPQFDLSQVLEKEGALSKYLSPQRYWEVNNLEINALAQKLKEPRQIYDFVVKTLKYDYGRVRKGAERLGAASVLQNPQQAICTEYTDLFLTLARAAGIPARELNGYAYTNNPVLQPLSFVQDVLHAWPEYWDSQKQTWIQIDPTWQSTTGGIDYFTKLDLGHFVFAVHGLDSQWPAPAGAYKTKDEGSFQKDIKVEFGQPQKLTAPEVKVAFVFPQKMITEVPTEGKIRIINEGAQAIYNLNINITSRQLTLLSKPAYFLNVLPPFGSREIILKIGHQRLLSSGIGEIKVLVNNQEFTSSFPYKSLVVNYFLPLLGGTLVIIAILFITRKLINTSLKQK